MALPVRIQQITKKAAGLYFIERTSRSIVAAAELDGFRLLIGQSKKGVTNKIVVIENYQEFVQLFGNIDTRLERRGAYFHRSAQIMLQQGAIKVLNLRSYDDTLDVVQGIGLNTKFTEDSNNILANRPYTNYFNTDRNWFVDEENIVPSNNNELLHIVNIGSKDLTVFVRPLKAIGYNQTLSEYYSLLGVPSPIYLEPTMLLNDTFVEVYVFNIDLSYGIPSNISYLFNSSGGLINNIIDANGRKIDGLTQLAQEEDSRFIGSYEGSLIPTLVTQTGATLAIDNLINVDTNTTGLISKINEDVLDLAADYIAPPLQQLNAVFTASNWSGGKRPIAIDFYGTSDIFWSGSNMVYTASADIGALSFDNSTTTLNYDSLSNDSNTLTQAYALEGGKVTAQEDVSIYSIFGNHIVHNNPMVLGKETLVTNTGDYLYSRPTEVQTINGKQYHTRNTLILTNITGVKVGQLFLGMDGNPTRVINVDFLGTKVVFDGLHTSSFPLDASGSPLGTFNTATGNWEYIGGVSIGLPIEYNYITDVNGAQYGYPLTHVGGTVIPFPPLSDADINNLITSNPTYASDRSYFIATFDRPVYCGDDDTTVVTKVGARSNTSILTLDNSLELVLYREPSANTNYAVQLNRVVDTAKELIPIPMKGLSARDKQFVNGTSTRLEEVLNDTMNGSLRDLLVDRDYESYNYIVDSFSSYPTSNIKYQFTNIGNIRQGGVTALINMPFVKTLKDSTDPYFKDQAIGSKLNVEYLESGGNTSLPYTQSFSLPTKQQGAAYGATFFPNATIIDNGRTIRMPMAPIVSNLFAAKWVAGVPYRAVFGSDYRISASGLGKIGLELTDEDREVLERIGVNPIMQDLMVLGNKTLNQDGTAFKSLHVRETLNVIQEEVKPIARAALGKQNTEQERARVKARIDTVLERYRANGALEYAQSIVDRTNNTDEVLENQLMIIDIELVVASIAEKVIIRTTAYNSVGEVGSVVIG